VLAEYSLRSTSIKAMELRAAQTRKCQSDTYGIDDKNQVMTVVDVDHRRDVYRS
jgi:hypothetical protein